MTGTELICWQNHFPSHKKQQHKRQSRLLLELSIKTTDQINAGNQDSPDLGGSHLSIAGDTFTGSATAKKCIPLSKALSQGQKGF